MFLGSRSAGFLHMDICTQHEMEITSGNLLVHWPIRQGVSFKQIRYIVKVWRNQEPITGSCTHGTAPQAEPVLERADGALARVLPNRPENHRYAQDAPSLCRRRQPDSELAADLGLLARQLHIIPLGTTDKYFYSYNSKYILVNKLIFHRWWNSTDTHWPGTMHSCFHFLSFAMFALGDTTNQQGIN